MSTDSEFTADFLPKLFAEKRFSMRDENLKNAADLQRELVETRRQLALQQATQRVHNAVLAMKQSDDLVQVTVTMYRELVSLGVETPALSIQLIDEESEDIWTCAVGENPRRQGISWTLPDLVEIDEELAVFAPKVYQPQVHRDYSPGFVERWRTGQVWTHESEEDKAKIEQWMEIFGLNRPLPAWGPGWMVTNVPFAHGTVGFRERTFHQESVVAVQALTEALSLGYVRFLDFQHLETQNRELTITNALERVRSEALAMQTTNDLPSVSGAVFREIQDLDIKAINTAIGVIDEERDQASQWTILPADFLEDAGSFTLVKVYDGISVADETWVLSKLRQVHPFYKEVLSSVTQDGPPVHLSKHWTKAEFLEEVVERNVELGIWTTDQAEDLRSWLSIDMDQSFLRHKQSYLMLLTLVPLSPREIEELKRFVEVFSFAYGRFLDLQDRERSTREALVEAALERIRSQALTMETSKDLPSVSATLYHETNALYDDAFNVGISVIGIVDEEQDLATQWSVFPEDASDRWKEDDYVEGDIHVQIELFALSALRSIDAYWKQAYRASNGESVFMSQQYSMQEAFGLIRKITKLSQWPREYGQGIEAHFRNLFEGAGVSEMRMGLVQFKQGILMTFVATPYSDSQIEELKRIGDVFAFGYGSNQGNTRKKKWLVGADRKESN